MKDTPFTLNLLNFLEMFNFGDNKTMKFELPDGLLHTIYNIDICTFKKLLKVQKASPVGFEPMTSGLEGLHRIKSSINAQLIKCRKPLIT